MRIRKPKIYKIKKYPHFDDKIHWNLVKSQVENSDYIVHHAFYPFIRYEQVMRKYPKNYIRNGRIGYRDEPKKRIIMYSSHIDRYIYEYYAYQLNKNYNHRLKKLGIDQCAIAYRTGMHKNNIHFARDAFSCIRTKNDCLIIIGDFTKYFDHLDHAYLKQRICDLLNVDQLPDDHYAVFRSITKHAWIELKEIQEFKQLTHKEFRNLDRLFSPEEFRKFKKEHLQRNPYNYGIPQGSAISAVYSNIYLLDFDRQMNELCRKFGGFYRRYCDDFILVLPFDLEKNQLYVDTVYKIKDSIKNLTLQQEKTQILHYCAGQITSLNEEYLKDVPNGKPQISYLGFTFDGQEVRIRSKTIAKYYERMYSKADNIVEADQHLSGNKRTSRRNIYRLYSYKGKKVSKKSRKRGNFLSYVDRAAKVFKSKSITKDTKNAWNKLQKRLHKPKD